MQRVDIRILPLAALAPKAWDEIRELTHHAEDTMRMHVLIVAAAAVFSAAALAGKPSVFSDRDGAIRGFDPVAYFSYGAAIKGSPRITYEWRGARWRFAHSENRARFVADPEKYAPQYGGYCAYAVAQGTVAEIDPAYWTVVDGKLYLNQSLEIRDRWRRDVPGYVRKADANWPKVLK